MDTDPGATPVFDELWQEYADKATKANDESWVLMHTLHVLDETLAEAVPF